MDGDTSKASNKEIQGLLRQEEEGTISVEDKRYLHTIQGAIDEASLLASMDVWPALSQVASSSKNPQPKRRTQAVGTQPQNKKSRCEKVQHVPATLRNVRFHTYGRATLGNIGPYNNMKEVKELREHVVGKGGFDYDLSRQAMRRVLRLKEDHPDPVIVNCRVFWEDFETIRHENDFRHSGKHPLNVSRIFKHQGGDTMRKLSKKLRQVVQEVQNSRKERDVDILDVCLECDHGKDRSVGVAVILENAFTLAGWKVSPTQHLCEGNWGMLADCARAAERDKVLGFNPHPPCPECQVKASYDIVKNNIDGGTFPDLFIPILSAQR